MGLRLYLSETTTALAFFFTGTKDGVSSSNPGEKPWCGVELTAHRLNSSSQFIWPRTTPGASPSGLPSVTSYITQQPHTANTLTSGAELGMAGCCGSKRLGLFLLLLWGLLSPRLSLHFSERSLGRGVSTLSLFFTFFLVFLCCGKTK